MQRLQDMIQRIYLRIAWEIGQTDQNIFIPASIPRAIDPFHPDVHQSKELLSEVIMH